MYKCWPKYISITRKNFVGVKDSPVHFSPLSPVFSSSRSEQPQLPPPCWPATSQSSNSSKQCPHPGSALRPGALCRPLPLPPGGQWFTTAGPRCPRQTELQSACCYVAGPLHGGDSAVQPGSCIWDQLVVASIAINTRTEQAVRISGGGCSTFTLGTTSDHQHQHTRTTGKNLNVNKPL